MLARHASRRHHAVAGAVANGTPSSAVGTAGYWIEFNDFTPARPPGFVTDAPHCNICFRREALALPNPFPAVPPCAEDLIFNHRFVAGGGTIYFDPAAIVTHLNRTRLTDYLSTPAHAWASAPRWRAVTRRSAAGGSSSGASSRS